MSTRMVTKGRSESLAHSYLKKIAGYDTVSRPGRDETTYLVDFKVIAVFADDTLTIMGATVRNVTTAEMRSELHAKFPRTSTSSRPARKTFKPENIAELVKVATQWEVDRLDQISDPTPEERADKKRLKASLRQAPRYRPANIAELVNTVTQWEVEKLERLSNPTPEQLSDKYALIYSAECNSVSAGNKQCESDEGTILSEDEAKAICSEASAENLSGLYQVLHAVGANKDPKSMSCLHYNTVFGALRQSQ